LQTRVRILGLPAKVLAILLLPLTLAGCLGNDETRAVSFVEDSNEAQPFPANYRPEILAFMHTYLNSPVGVRGAQIAEPVQRTVGGRARFVACLRYSERQSDGSYREPRERAIVFVSGRLDRIMANASEECAGAVYGAFPDLEKMQR
jgi:hypothetical protein